MDSREDFERHLADAFDSDAASRRVVARQARDLADSGKLDDDAGRELTPAGLVAELRDAPDDYSLPERWNWWMGALELAYGGYERFRIVRWDAGSDA